MIFSSFAAIRMKRRLTSRPNPRSSGCVTFNARPELMIGLNEFENELTSSRLFTKLALTLAPVLNPWL